MVQCRIDPGSAEIPQSPQPSRTIDRQLASLSATLRDVQNKVSRTPTNSKSHIDPTLSEASNQDSYQESYHGEDPGVVIAYQDIPQHDPPEYTAAPPAYDPSLSYNQPVLHPPHPTPVIPIPITSDLSASDPSRYLIRHETSKSITGTYTLQDLIDFSTTSGSICINVQLSDANILNPHPSSQPTLKLSTKSGSIKLMFETPRFTSVAANHTTLLTTVSGSIIARIFHGLSTSISTSSGSQILKIYPSALSNESYLTTTSKSGSQKIAVYEPEGTAGTKLDNFRADITTMGSASLHLSYPRTWEGTVHASSGGSSSVNVHGRDIEVVDFGKREAHGTRGEGSRTELVGNGSGSIYFWAN